MSKIINRLLAICEWLAFAICTCLLIAVLYDSFDNYFKYPTGNSIVQSNQELLPFPAITICSSYYEWGNAYQVFSHTHKPLMKNGVDFIKVENFS